MSNRVRALSLPLSAAILSIGLPTSAHATYPGTNGPVLYGSYAPHGKRGAYRSDLYLAALDGTALGSRFATKADEHGGTVSPNGTQLAFVRGTSIWFGDVGGTSAQRLTTDDIDENWPQFSPDGRRLIYSSYDRGIMSVAIDGTTTAKSRVLVPSKIGRKRWTSLSVPRLTPDGTKLLYLSVTYTASKKDGLGDPGRSELWMANADGSSPRRLLRATKIVWDYDIAPDGQRLAFVASRSWRKSPRTVSITQLDGSAGQTVVKADAAKASFSGVSFSPDGAMLAVVQNGGTIKQGGRLDLLTFASGSRRTIAAVRGAWVESPAWAPGAPVQ